MRLFNGSRRILHKRRLLPQAVSELRSQPDGWRQILNPDVVKFVEDLSVREPETTPERKAQVIRQLLHSPANFFSRPSNVPLSLRKQTYLPDVVITLHRTTKLSPQYARFTVPLWFSKLDFRNYLSNVYGVDVIHVRSQVRHAKVTRDESQGRQRGRLQRGAAHKTMTVELVDPFVWPEEEKDLTPWEHDESKLEDKDQTELYKELQGYYAMRPDPVQRKSIAAQAREYLQGKKKWEPTWPSIVSDQKLYGKESGRRPE